MTVLRCTAKVLKRLRQPAKPEEPTPGDNPLGEWYADLDVWRRQPFVLMLNASTGAALVLPGNADWLRRMHEAAFIQFGMLCEHFDIAGPGVEAELQGFRSGFRFGATRDRSLLSSMNQRKYAVWMQLEHNSRSLGDAAAMEWNGLFKHRSLGRDARFNSDYHSPIDLLRARLLPAADILPFPTARR